MRIEPLAPPVTPEDFEDLVGVLTECVAGGASIGFLAPLARDEAETFWRKVLGEIAGGHRAVLVAREPAGRIVGTAQAVFETKANGRHRAEVQKVLVRPAHRRRGIAARLMGEIEALAAGRGVWLLHLDTSDSQAGARPFYEALHYAYAGGIPFYATDTRGRPEANAIFYKTLAPPAKAVLELPAGATRASRPHELMP
ncbi:MAG TPA: GNAT family N-acetyltransferase, partial [Opitutus sp.]|nr:GNAT family N-acetyltransferase [Opitutus sp.]